VQIADFRLQINDGRLLHFAFCILHSVFCIQYFAFGILHSAFCIRRRVIAARLGDSFLIFHSGFGGGSPGESM
jgi:hypothetical protein